MFATRSILLSLGLFLCTIAAMMLLPAIVDLADRNPDWKVFAASALLCFFIGSLLILFASDDRPATLDTKSGFLLTTLTWVVVTAFCAVPFIGVGLSYTDAYFETMSGLTTTGSTVLVKLDTLPRGVLLWRSILQGIGGLGIIVTAIIMLPFLRIGGAQLFQTESSDKSEKIVPRAIQLSTAIAIIYLVMIAACTAAYLALGMTGFDALCHALATVSTGGYSTHDESFGFFKSSALEWTCILFMILGSLPFVTLYKTVGWDRRAIFQDTQVRAFLLIIVVVSIAMALWLMTKRPISALDAIRTVAFHVVSIITTTGFATDDYTRWGATAVGAFFMLTFIGGCSGSTSGGIKIYRLQIAGVLTKAHLVKLISPNRIAPVKYGGRHLTDEVMFSVVTFLFVFFVTVGLFTLLLTSTGLDLTTSISATVQALANVGPGLGPIVGPAGNFSTLSDTAKWALSCAMLLGRLELFTVLVLLQPEFWTR